MNHPFLHMDDEALYEHVVSVLKKNNPTNFFGERLRGPIDTVWNGKLYDRKQVDGDVINLDFTPEHIPDPQAIVKVGTLKIKFSDLESVRFPFEGHYIYPYAVMVPHRKWLTEKDPGDRARVVDSEFSPLEITLTDEIFEEHMYLFFRHAVSAH